MHQPPRMSMDERAARRVILAEAIETGDREGRLLSQAERDQIDSQARHAALAGAGDERRIRAERFLDLRAQRVIEAVEPRQPALAALQHEGSWPQWMATVLPLGAVVLGVLTDAVANPHRVDLLSLPLLGLLAWNLAMYLLLAFGGLLWPRRRPGTQRPLRGAEGLLRWRERRPGHLRADITARFHWRWQGAARGLWVQRTKRALHLSAAGWAVGVALSLLVRGLVVEYRVGWESTFLDAGQVHAILSVLRVPALLLFPFEPFTVQEVAALQFSRGGGSAAGARWVFMYVALLIVVVIVPRLALAGWAWLQERRLARRVPLDARDPYFQRVLSLLTAARVHLALLAHRAEDAQALRQVLLQEPDAGEALIASPQGDVLQLLDVSGLRPPSARNGQTRGWMGRLQALFGADRARVEPALQQARELTDVVLHVARGSADLEQGAALATWLGRPVLLLARQAGPELADAARAHPLVREVLPLDAFADAWTHESLLMEAIARCLPAPAQPGFARISAAWEQRNQLRFHRAMCAVAEHLLYAARQSVEVASGRLGVKSLVPAERDAQAKARQDAMDQVVQRLDVSAGELFSRLRVLHGLEATDAVALQHRLQEKFVVQQAVDLPQAGMAGAASGAAMGASVDLMVGGLTLGAATALGALVGGGAAYVAAAWKNRSTPAGGTLVQLSDEMLQALAEAALLRYLAVAHHGRADGVDGDQAPAAWTPQVVAAVEGNRERLAPFWTAARTQPEPARLVSALARELETVARQVLDALHPAANR